jgi:hypothetical protein
LAQEDRRRVAIKPDDESALYLQASALEASDIADHVAAAVAILAALRESGLVRCLEASAAWSGAA